MFTLQAFLYVLHFFLMFPFGRFVQGVWRSFAIYGHPGFLSQRQIRHGQNLPRFCPFESAQKQAEIFALNIECHEFDELQNVVICAQTVV